MVIDGTRGPDEIHAFKKAFGEDLVVVALHSAEKTRFARLKGRGRPDSPSTLEEFAKREHRELAWGLGEVIACADYMIVNEGTIADLRREVNHLLDGIIGRR